MNKSLSGGYIGGNGDVVHVAESEKICFVGLVRLGCERISEHEQKIDLVAGYSGSYLLVAALTSAEEALNLKSRCLGYELARSAGRAQGMAAQDTAISYTELGHKFFFLSREP